MATALTTFSDYCESRKNDTDNIGNLVIKPLKSDSEGTQPYHQSNEFERLHKRLTTLETIMLEVRSMLRNDTKRPNEAQIEQETTTQ